MALEDRQRLHNRVISSSANFSPANDLIQQAHDANASLIGSAAKFAAGRELGMTEEETLAYISKAVRRQKRQDDSFSEQDAVRQMVQSANSLSDVSRGAEIRGVGYSDDNATNPFGQDQGEYYEYQPDDRQYEEQQQGRIRDEMVDMEDRYFDKFGNERVKYQKGDAVLKTGVNPEEYKQLSDELKEMTPTREAVTPKSALRETLRQLEAAEEQKSGVGGLITRLIRGQSADMPSKAAVAGRLEDEIAYGPTQQGAEKSLSAELVRRDSERFNPLREGYSDVRSAMEAEDIARRLFTIGGQGAIADASMARIPMSMQERVASMPQIAQRADGIYIDPSSGNTVALQGPGLPPDDVLNTGGQTVAARPQSAQEFVVSNQPDYRQNDRLYGDYPNVDVTGTTTLFADRVRGTIPGMENVSSNIRGVGDLQRSVDFIVGQGGKFYDREPVEDPKTGRTKLKNVRSEAPGTQQVLNKLRYTPAESSALANALYQLEVAKNSTINQQGKQQYFTRTGPYGSAERVTFDAPEAINPREGAAEIARISPGQTIEGQDIVTALRGLETPAARTPFIGQVAGEEPRINRYNRTGQTDLEGIADTLRRQEEGFSKKTGKPIDEPKLRGKVVKAALAQERKDRDEKQRVDRMSALIETLPPNARRTRLRGM